MKLNIQQFQEQGRRSSLKPNEQERRHSVLRQEINQYESFNKLKPSTNIFSASKDNNESHQIKENFKRKGKSKSRILSKTFSNENHKNRSQKVLKKKHLKSHSKTKGMGSTKNAFDASILSKYYNYSKQSQGKLISLPLEQKKQTGKVIKRKGKTLNTMNKMTSTYESQINKEEQVDRLKMFIDRYANNRNRLIKRTQQRDSDMQHREIQKIVNNMMLIQISEGQNGGQQMFGKQQQEKVRINQQKNNKDHIDCQEQGLIQLPNQIRNRFELKKTIKNKDLLKDRYKMMEKIGKGLSGEVYKAKDILSNKFVAIKITRIIKDKPQFQYQFYKKIQHQNIVKYYNNFVINRDRYLILQYFPYTLSTLVKIKKLDQEEIKYIFKNIVNGISFLHGLSIAHRDIKMENIVISEDLKSVKFIDFGFCIDLTQLENHTSTQFCGTMSYIPPQMLQKKPYNPKNADIWSLGILLYKLMFERYPYRGNDERQMLTKIIGTKLVFAEGCNMKLRRLLERMLVKNEKNRIKINEIVEHEWFN